MLEKNIRTITYNSEVLEQESKKYQEWLDEKTEEVYNLASKTI
jgi:hypothetical protein